MIFQAQVFKINFLKVLRNKVLSHKFQLRLCIKIGLESFLNVSGNLGFGSLKDQNMFLQILRTMCKVQEKCPSDISRKNCSFVWLSLVKIWATLRVYVDLSTTGRRQGFGWTFRFRK